MVVDCFRRVTENGGASPKLLCIPLLAEREQQLNAVRCTIEMPSSPAQKVKNATERLRASGGTEEVAARGRRARWGGVLHHR